MRKQKTPHKAFAFIFLFLTVFALVAVGFAQANWVYLPSSPTTEKPTIVIQSPSNGSNYLENVTFAFTINVPNSWIVSGKSIGDIQSIEYQIDNESKRSIAITNQFPSASTPQLSYDYSFLLTELSLGSHTLSLSVKGSTRYWPEGTPPPCSQKEGDTAPEIPTYDSVTVATVSFNIDTYPKVTVLEPINQTYLSTSVSLKFSINKQVASMTYSLDGAPAVSTDGNLTIAGLSYGAHTVVVQATDEAGATGTSKTIHFSLASPPQPTPPPQQTDAVIFIVTAPIAGIVVAATIVFAVFFKKRKK